MKLIKTILFLSALALCSCKGTDEGGESKPEGIVMNQIGAASLSATVSCTFNDLSDKDLMYGRVVVLYSDADNAADQFGSWQNGNEKPDCQVFKKGNVKSGGGFEARLTGLQPDTEYSCCVGFASEDGSRREIGSLMTFVTLPFNPEITTGAAASIRYYDAILDGTVMFAAETDADACTTGLLLSTAQGATAAEGTVLAAKLGDRQQFALIAAGLQPDMEYYYRAYASYKDAAGNDVYRFGREKSFTTKSYDEMAVDLGLSVKWADCNLGDQEFVSYDSGNHSAGYCWGHTFSQYGNKVGYTVNPKDYKYLSYYNNLYDYGYLDIGKDISGTEYDAAKAILGGKWRMPTKEEAMELAACSTKAVKGQYHDNVFLKELIVTGPNGNSIQFNVVKDGQLWTSTSHDDNIKTYILRSKNNEDCLEVIASDKVNRYREWPIRPVCDY